MNVLIDPTPKNRARYRNAGIVNVAVFFLGFFCLSWFASTASLAGISQMRVITTRHYVIHTDLERTFADDLGRRLDAMYDEYSRRLSEFTPPPEEAMEVYLFEKRSDYIKFTENKVPNTGGVFMAGRNLLAAFLEEQGRDALRRTLQHEAFHQFAFHAIGPDLPVWLNEGMAQVFEEGIWTGDRFVVGQIPPRRVRQLQTDMSNRRLIDFKTLLGMSHETWSDNLAREVERGTTQYNQSWAMVHFLVYGGAQSGADYRERFLRLLKLLHNNVSPDAAFTQAFSNNYKGFQDRFVEWARAIQPTPEATLIERQEILGDMLIALSDKGRTFTNADAFRKSVVEGGFRLRYRRGDMQWQTDEDTRVYFSDLAGQSLAQDQLFFESRQGQLPDLLCLSDNLRLRTRFFQSGGRLEREVRIEANSR